MAPGVHGHPVSGVAQGPPDGPGRPLLAPPASGLDCPQETTTRTRADVAPRLKTMVVRRTRAQGLVIGARLQGPSRERVQRSFLRMSLEDSRGKQDRSSAKSFELRSLLRVATRYWRI